MAKLSAGELRSGTVFMYRGDPWQVKKYEHVKKGRGSAKTKVKIRNLKSGEFIEETFDQNYEFEEADVTRTEGQFLYKDEGKAHFMNAKTYDQYDVKRSAAGSALDFLPEGEKVDLILFEGGLIGIEPKKTANLKVTEAEPAVKGDTTSGATKKVSLETGAKIDVPLFVKKGDAVKVNTEKGEYVSRAEE